MSEVLVIEVLVIKVGEGGLGLGDRQGTLVLWLCLLDNSPNDLFLTLQVIRLVASSSTREWLERVR